MKRKPRFRARCLTCLLACCLLAPLLSPRPAAGVERVVAVADGWMPYSGTPNSDREGYAVEVLRSVLEERGFSVEYRELPWKRAMQEVLSGQADILVCATRDKMPALVYPGTPLGRSDLCFFALDRHWRFAGPDSLADVVTGFVQGYNYPSWFMEDMERHPGRFHALHGGDAFARMLAMLAEGRVQAIPGCSAVVDYYARQTGLDGKIFMAGCSGDGCHELYFGLSPANRPRSTLLAAILDEGMHVLRTTGRLDHLLVKYGLKDPVKVH